MPASRARGPLQLSAALALALACLVTVSCERVSPASIPTATVGEVWDYYYGRLERYSNGRSIDLQVYARAVVFFEDLTGIEYEDNRSFFGRLPVDEMEHVLAEWASWMTCQPAEFRSLTVQEALSSRGAR